MHGRGLWFLLAGLGAFVGRAQAQSVALPLWANTPGAVANDSARAQFEAATRQRGMGPLETVEVPDLQASRTATLLGEAMTAAHASNFVLAAAVFAETVNQALAAGGAGLSQKEFASLFFHQGMAIQLASGAIYAEPFAEITPPDAKTAYLRAAVLGATPTFREMAARPLVEASWRLASAIAAQRVRGSLTVRARPKAQVFIDNRPALTSPATVSSLLLGEHFVRVEEPGHGRRRSSCKDQRSWWRRPPRHSSLSPRRLRPRTPKRGVLRTRWLASCTWVTRLRLICA